MIEATNKPVFLLSLLALFVACPALGREPDAKSLSHGLGQVLEWAASDSSVQAQYDYVVTGKLRLLFFWVGRDDVGEGYIRLRRSPSLDAIELKFGSDPDKAPRGINRWGAATELLHHGGDTETTSAFFGFWRSAKGGDRQAMERELSTEAATRRYLYEAAINRVEPHYAASCVVPLFSELDLDIHQEEEAEAMVFRHFASGPWEDRVKVIEGRERLICNRSRGFLFTIKDMTDAVLSGRRAPFSLCYLHNARRYMLTVTSADLVADKTIRYKLHSGEVVETPYRDLVRVKARACDVTRGKSSSFELLLGSTDSLRGVPVQIVHQPNWWFKVVLNLRSPRQPKRNAEATPQP